MLVQGSNGRVSSLLGSEGDEAEATAAAGLAVFQDDLSSSVVLVPVPRKEWVRRVK